MYEELIKQLRFLASLELSSSTHMDDAADAITALVARAELAEQTLEATIAGQKTLQKYIAEQDKRIAELEKQLDAAVHAMRGKCEFCANKQYDYLSMPNKECWRCYWSHSTTINQIKYTDNWRWKGKVKS